MCSRVGMCRRTQAPIAEDAPTSAAIPEQAPLFALPVAFLDRLALVVGLLALGERQFDLGAAARVEIDRQRHQRHPLAGDSAVQLVDLAFVEKQLARALGLVVEAVAVAELGDDRVSETIGRASCGERVCRYGCSS